MNQWKEYKIGDLVKVNQNSIPKDFAFNDIEYLDTGSITNGKIDGFQNYNISDAPSRARRLLTKYDIIYSTVRPIQRHYGLIANPKPNTVVSTGFAVLTCDIQISDPYFIYYYLTQDDIVNYLDSVAEGSTSAYPSLTPEVITDIDILVPELKEQQTIASILSSLDDKIDLLHRQNKTLEQLADTLFHQWFIEDSNDSWEEKSLDEIADFLNGLALQKYPSKGLDNLSVIKIREMKQGISENTDICNREIPSQYIIHNGDVLFSWSGSLEVVIWYGGEGALNQHLFKVSSNKYPKWFYYLATKHHLPTFKAIAESKTTTMGTHTKRTFKTGNYFYSTTRTV